jgi:hypothetical protein
MGKTFGFESLNTVSRAARSGSTGLRRSEILDLAPQLGSEAAMEELARGTEASANGTLAPAIVIPMRAAG